MLIGTAAEQAPPARKGAYAMHLIRTTAQHLLEAERAASRRVAVIRAPGQDSQLVQAAAAQGHSQEASPHDTAEAERQL
jgi:hypothetical protein